MRLWASLAGEDEAGSFLCGAKGVFTVHLHCAFEESRFALTADAGAAFIRDVDRDGFGGFQNRGIGVNLG